MAYSPTVADAKQLIEFNSHVYGETDIVPDGWHVLMPSEVDPISGFKAIAYQNNQDPSKIVIAIAGTQSSRGARGPGPRPTRLADWASPKPLNASRYCPPPAGSQLATLTR